MAFGSLRIWDIPMLTNYNSAVAHEAKVKPIRGDANGTKPLGDRKRKWFNIRKDATTTDIIVKMHSTDLVRYRADGTVIVNNGGWVSASTHDMLWALLGMTVRTFNSKAWVTCNYLPMGQQVAVYGEYVLPNGEDIPFRYENSRWQTSDIELPYVHKVDRARANLVRAAYKPFRKYLTSMLKLRTEPVESRSWDGTIHTTDVVTVEVEEARQHNLQEYRFNFNSNSYSEADNLKGLMLSGDPDLYYKAMMRLTRISHGYWYGGGTRPLRVYPKDVLTQYNKLLMFIHRKDVLVRYPCEDAKAKRDPYGAWFK